MRIPLHAARVIKVEKVMKLARLSIVIFALLLVHGAPTYARGGGGGGGGHAGGGFGGGGYAVGGGGHAPGGGHAFGGGHSVGSGHAVGGPHAGGLSGHHGFDGHHHFGGHHHRFHGSGFVGFAPFYWGPYWDSWDPYWGYGPYAYYPSQADVEPPMVYIQKPQAAYCPSGHASYPDAGSCAEPWVAAPQAVCP